MTPASFSKTQLLASLAQHLAILLRRDTTGIGETILGDGKANDMYGLDVGRGGEA